MMDQYRDRLALEAQIAGIAGQARGDQYHLGYAAALRDALQLFDTLSDNSPELTRGKYHKPEGKGKP